LLTRTRQKAVRGVHSDAEGATKLLLKYPRMPSQRTNGDNEVEREILNTFAIHEQ